MKEFTQRELKLLNSNKGLFNLLIQDELNYSRALRYTYYERKMEALQEQLVLLQEWVIKKGKKIVVICEGRDAAGKGGAIRRMTQFLNPRQYRVVALPKPDEDERNQWYFQRYVNQLPKNGEIVFFNRSWYNRAVVEPVNGFCTEEEYDIFMNQVNPFEKMITESGIFLLKIYFSISKQEQKNRFDRIQSNPLKKWKMSNVDKRAQELWDDYTHYKDIMMEKTNTDYAPWKIIKADRKTSARLESAEFLLKSIPYENLRNAESSSDVK